MIASSGCASSAASTAALGVNGEPGLVVNLRAKNERQTYGCAGASNSVINDLSGQTEVIDYYCVFHPPRVAWHTIGDTIWTATFAV
jgi:hypothetical protein